ncbi:unnamed protein product [[Candida] boidinii]|nr:unnamed protein product [[Candida] boidinii]
MKKRLSRNINYKRNSLISVPPPEIPTASSSNKSSTQNSSASSLKNTSETEPEQQEKLETTQENQSTMSKINGLGKSFSEMLHFSKKKKIPEDADVSKISNISQNASPAPAGDGSIDISLTETVYTNEIDQNNSLKNTDYYSGDESSVSESNFINIDDHRKLTQDEDEPEHELMSGQYNNQHKNIR